MTVSVGICVNPMSGRDVRRLAARASNMTFEAKRDVVARVAAGADAAGCTDIYVTQEPFRIASLALQHAPLSAHVHVLEHPIKNNASDTETAIGMFRAAGVDTIVSLGGDGTNRAIARAHPEIALVPLSTGTNNVFPVLAEPTIAGMVAALDAAKLLPGQFRPRAKVLHLKVGGVEDIALIDVLLLRRDHVGNMLPFDADRMARLVLSRAEANAIGTSPVGGLIEEVGEADDAGLLVEMGEGTAFNVPLAPGSFQTVRVKSASRFAFDMPIPLTGPGVIALDGDRDHKLREGDAATVTLRRDGPAVLDIDGAMRWAVAEGIMRDQLLA